MFWFCYWSHDLHAGTLWAGPSRSGILFPGWLLIFLFLFLIISPCLSVRHEVHCSLGNIFAFIVFFFNYSLIHFFRWLFVLSHLTFETKQNLCNFLRGSDFSPNLSILCLKMRKAEILWQNHWSIQKVSLFLFELMPFLLLYYFTCSVTFISFS